MFYFTCNHGLSNNHQTWVSVNIRHHLHSLVQQNLGMRCLFMVKNNCVPTGVCDGFTVIELDS